MAINLPMFNAWCTSSRLSTVTWNVITWKWFGERDGYWLVILSSFAAEGLQIPSVWLFVYVCVCMCVCVLAHIRMSGETGREWMSGWRSEVSEGVIYSAKILVRRGTLGLRGVLLLGINSSKTQVARFALNSDLELFNTMILSLRYMSTLLGPQNECLKELIWQFNGIHRMMICAYLDVCGKCGTRIWSLKEFVFLTAAYTEPVTKISNSNDSTFM